MTYWSTKVGRKRRKERKRKSFEDLVKFTHKHVLNKMNNTTKLDTYGELCPRCGLLTEVRKHKVITQKHLNQPYYYSQWFKCVNPKCRTTLIMLDRFRVYPEDTRPWIEEPMEDIVINTLNEEKPPWE